MPMDRKLAEQLAAEISAAATNQIMQQLELAWEEGFQAGQRVNFERANIARELVEMREDIAEIVKLVGNQSFFDPDDKIKIPNAERVSFSDLVAWLDDYSGLHVVSTDHIDSDTTEIEEQLGGLSERLGKLVEMFSR
jgi:hypothetical protein